MVSGYWSQRLPDSRFKHPCSPAGFVLMFFRCDIPLDGHSAPQALAGFVDSCQMSKCWRLVGGARKSRKFAISPNQFETVLHRNPRILVVLELLPKPAQEAEKLRITGLGAVEIAFDSQ